MKTIGIFRFGALLAVAASLGLAQEKRRFLDPADMIKIMEESKTSYFVSTLDKLKPEETQNLAAQLFPRQCPEIAYPRVEHRGEKASVAEFTFKKEAMLLVEQAEPGFSQNKYDEAQKLYEEAVRLDPDCYPAEAGIGDCHFFCGRYEKALEHYERAILLNPSDHRLYFFRGNTLLRLNRSIDAKRSYIRALALRPRYAYLLQAVQSQKEALKFEFRGTLFSPQVLVRRDGENVSLYVDADNRTSHWLTYGIAKAVWLGEPGHREEMTGKSDALWTSIEERECLGNLIAMYDSLVRDRKTKVDPDLESLKRIIERGEVESFLLYEMASRICPTTMLLLPDETRARVEGYIEKYLLVPVK